MLALWWLLFSVLEFLIIGDPIRVHSTVTLFLSSASQTQTCSELATNMEARTLSCLWHSYLRCYLPFSHDKTLTHTKTAVLCKLVETHMPRNFRRSQMNSHWPAETLALQPARNWILPTAICMKWKAGSPQLKSEMRPASILWPWAEDSVT